MADHPFDELNEPGLLTKSDRQYLLGEKSYDDSTMERRARKRMRDRIRGGLRDFWFLVHQLPANDRRQLVTELNDDDLPKIQYRHEEILGLIEVIAFVYGLSNDLDLELQTLVHNGLVEARKSVVSSPFALREFEVKIETQAGIEGSTVLDKIEAGKEISRLEYIELSSFLIEEWDEFVEATKDIELPDLEDRDRGDTLTMGESLVFFAQSEPGDGTLSEVVEREILHPTVIREFLPIPGES